MTTDNWQQFKDIFQTALEMPDSERPSYLKRVCPQSATRAELEALLLCYEKPPENGTKTAILSTVENGPQTVQHDPLIESFLDHYQIVKKVGERAFASQYLGLCLTDPALKQVVLTILKTSEPADDFFRSFKKDRSILINLRHPNIASFLDSGTARSGSPYLVTEHIEATPIDEFCDSNQLNTRRRIELFLNVCDAVQFAHEHFIAHGAINSRNVVLTSAGVPKLLDVALPDFLDRNRSTPAVQTERANLESLSPEQIRGEPITAGDDAYSLGVMLYRLLTGHSPYWMKAEKEGEPIPSIFEAIRPSKVIYQVAEQSSADGRKVVINPGRLSHSTNEETGSINRQLKGDLDSIILKAIHKDPAKRYTSIEQFSRDLRHHLDQRTVSARKPTVLYRAGKFIRRHKAATIAFLIAGLLSILPAVVLLRQLFAER